MKPVTFTTELGGATVRLFRMTRATFRGLSPVLNCIGITLPSILSSTDNAALFCLSIFKTDNNLKSTMANNHLHSMSIFLHYQIRVSCAHARVLEFEYKSDFSVLHLHMLILFQKLVHSYTPGRSASKCMYNEMSKSAKKRQDSRSRLTVGTHPSDVSKGSTPLYQAADATECCRPNALLCKSKMARLNKKYRDSE